MKSYVVTCSFCFEKYGASPEADAAKTMQGVYKSLIVVRSGSKLLLRLHVNFFALPAFDNINIGLLKSFHFKSLCFAHCLLKDVVLPSSGYSQTTLV